MINFPIWFKKKSGSPKGAPHDRCRRTMEKNILQWKPMELGGVPEKWMNISTGDLYSMYVVLQGIRFLPCIRLYIIYVIPFGEQQPWMPAVPKLERFNKKNRPKWSIYFYIVSKKWFFQAHRRVYPPPPVSEKYEKKTILQWKPMEFGGVPEKIDGYFQWGPIFYVCNSQLGLFHV